MRTRILSNMPSIDITRSAFGFTPNICLIRLVIIEDHGLICMLLADHFFAQKTAGSPTWTVVLTFT